ncbi:MAG: hypothetical protein GXO90_01470 [FCB group bacterium]|nr:hypothetical protein [FCB group bacterium]
MATAHYLVLDLGTSSSKAFIFTEDRTLLFSHRVKHALYRPAPHHVEADATAILTAVRELIHQATDWARVHRITLASAGMACQRSTFLFWDKSDGHPLGPALSWQDSRAADVVQELSDYSAQIQRKTGIPLSAHFGGPKYRHLLDHNKELRVAVDHDSAWFGPLSAFIVSQLSEVNAVDESIAGRSLFYDLDERTWGVDLLRWFGVQPSALPPVMPVLAEWGRLTGVSGSIPLRCVIGDQQAALIGQGGGRPGTLAMNFGTSGSVQFNTGSDPRHIPGLLSNVLVSDSHEAVYLIEGTINACNSLFYWLEDFLHIPHREMVWDQRTATSSTAGAFVPGFVGLAAPYWKDQIETVFYRLSETQPDEIIRAAMESIGFLVHDILITMDESLAPEPISVSGGGSRPPLLQFLADLLNHPVGHSTMRDRTALGVLRLLHHSDLHDEDTGSLDFDPVYFPTKDADWRQEKRATWATALKQAGIKVVKGRKF